MFVSNGNSYTVSTESDMCIYTHVLHNTEMLVWGSVTAACHFGHAYHRFVSPAVYWTGRRDLNPRPLHTFLFLLRNCPPWAYAASLRFLDHTKLHTHAHTPGRASQKAWSARHRGHCLHNKDKGRKYRALSEIRTRDPSRRAAADPRLRLHDHWDRRLRITL
jgi:hypothetical protein